MTTKHESHDGGRHTTVIIKGILFVRGKVPEIRSLFNG